MRDIFQLGSSRSAKRSGLGMHIGYNIYASVPDGLSQPYDKCDMN